MRFALLGLRQPQRVLRVGSPRLFVDKPSGTHLTYHPDERQRGGVFGLGRSDYYITVV